jgi:hypothetical protein
MVSLYGRFRQTQLFLHNFRLYAQVRQFISQSLGLYPQCLALLLADLELLLHHDTSFDGDVVFGFYVL